MPDILLFGATGYTGRLTADALARKGASFAIAGRNKAKLYALARENRYEVTDYIGYPTPGSLGSYAGVDRDLPIITLELSRGVGERQAWQENRDALVAAVQFADPGFGAQEHWAK